MRQCSFKKILTFHLFKNMLNKIMCCYSSAFSVVNTGYLDKLTELNANGNCFTVLPPDIVRLKNLELLRLSGVSWMDVKFILTRDKLTKFINRYAAMKVWMDAHPEVCKLILLMFRLI